MKCVLCKKETEGKTGKIPICENCYRSSNQEEVMQKYKQQYQQEYIVNEEFELAVNAWILYHQAAEKIDGRYGKGPFPEGVIGRAIKAGIEAMSSVAPFEMVKGNTRAKLEALRRLGLD